MGLDMYLSARLRTYKSLDKKEKEHPIRKIIRKNLPEIFKSGNIEYMEISFEAGYWRKANQIHKWFVDNVQNGKDDCNKYYVSRTDLQKLLDVCKEVIKSCKTKKAMIQNGIRYKDGKETPIMEEGHIIIDSSVAQKLLPVASGFFFGGTDYDEYYLNDVKRTKDIIKKCLQLPKEWVFEYHSSW